MHPRDPRDLSQSSQSLDDIVKRFDALYKYSPLPFAFGINPETPYIKMMHI
jgi:hypothetical protein